MITGIFKEGESARGEQARGRTNQGANKPGGEAAKHRRRTSHGAKKPGGESARERTSQGANRQRSEKAIILIKHGYRHGFQTSVGFAEMLKLPDLIQFFFSSVIKASVKATQNNKINYNLFM